MTRIEALPLLPLLAGAVMSCGGPGVAALPGVSGARATPAGPCSDFEQDVERVWSSQRKAVVTAAFVELGVDYADRVVERVTTKMDDLTANWVMLSERLCKDYLVRKALTKREYAARSACFDSALMRQRTFVHMLSTPNKGYVSNALRAFEDISDKLDECQNQAVWGLYAGDAELANEGRSQADAFASEAVLAAKLGDPERAERAASQAVALAGASGSARAVLDSLLAAALVDVRRARFDDAGRKLEQATARAKALGAQLSLALAYQYTGQLHHERHEEDLAIAAYQRALTLRRKLLPSGDPRIAWTLDNLGAAFHARGDDRRAVALHEEALALYRKRPGERESAVADALSNLGLAFAGLGDHARAIEYYEQALAIDQPTVHDDRPAVADTLLDLGLSYRERGDLPRALEALARAVAIHRAAYGERHPHLARALYALGSIYLRAGDWPNAAAALQQSLAAFEADDSTRAAAHNDLGVVQGHLADYRSAAREFAQALSLRTKLQTTPPAEIADNHVNLGVALTAAGDAATALTHLQKALELYRRTPGADAQIIDTLEHLGFAYRRLGDCPRARDALQQAHRLCVTMLGPADAHSQHLAANLASACVVRR